jgi:hypothetical protein
MIWSLTSHERLCPNLSVHKRDDYTDCISDRHASEMDRQIDPADGNYSMAQGDHVADAASYPRCHLVDLRHHLSPFFVEKSDMVLWFPVFCSLGFCLVKLVSFPRFLLSIPERI